MATLKDPLSTLKIQQNKVDNILKDNQTAGRGSDAKSWLQNWRYERGIPKDSGVMPSVDEVPLYYRPYLFPRADASPTNGLKIAETAADMARPTTGGFFLDDNGGAFINTPNGLIYDGEYNPDVHGMPVPLAKNKAKNGMKIATNPDFEIEKQILDARTNKKAQEDAGQDMLLDRIFNKKNTKKGKA